MKKLISFILVAQMLMMLSVPTLAEEFTLRNGIQFGDTMEEVMAKETIPFDKKKENKNNELWTEKGEVAGFSPIAINYLFDNNGQLTEVVWNIPIQHNSIDNIYETLGVH